jgi:phage shock protein E
MLLQVGRKNDHEVSMKRIVLLLIVLLLTACQGASSASGAAITNVSPAELNSMLANKDFVFVNVHIPFEGDIAGTDLSIPFDQITEPGNISLLPADKDAKIVLYCRSGRMSAIAANSLQALGYTNLYDLEGGMIAWEQQGFELIGQ